MIQPSSFHSRLGRWRQCVAFLVMPVFADRQRLPVDREPDARGGGLHDLDGLRNDLEADVVAEQNSDFQAGVSPNGTARQTEWPTKTTAGAFYDRTLGTL